MPAAALLLAITLAGPAAGIASAAPAEVSAQSRHATACQARPESRRYWAWREISGRRCWYRGRRGRKKAALYWPPPNVPSLRWSLAHAPYAMPLPRRRPQPPQRVLLETVWPAPVPLPVVLPFAERWAPLERRN